MIPTLLVLHGGDGHIDLVYFWSAVFMAGIPVGVFVVIGFLAVRAYFRRREADGGGEVESRDRDSLHAGFRGSSGT